GLNKSYACLRQSYALTIPERELPANEIRIIEYRVEACGFVVRRILIALRPEERGAETKVVFINRSLDRSHVRFYSHTSACNRITIIAPKCEVIRVRDIQSPDVPVAADAYVADLD